MNETEFKKHIKKLNHIGSTIAGLKSTEASMEKEVEKKVVNRFFNSYTDRPSFGSMHNVTFEIRGGKISFWWEEDDPNGGYFESWFTYSLKEFFGWDEL